MSLVLQNHLHLGLLNADRFWTEWMDGWMGVARLGLPLMKIEG